MLQFAIGLKRANTPGHIEAFHIIQIHTYITRHIPKINLHWLSRNTEAAVSAALGAYEAGMNQVSDHLDYMILRCPARACDFMDGRK